MRLRLSTGREIKDRYRMMKNGDQDQAGESESMLGIRVAKSKIGIEIKDRKRN
jgi:hypothetical protein